jgi:hypothetical protein
VYTLSGLNILRSDYGNKQMLILTYIRLVMTHGDVEVARKENISKEVHRFSAVVLFSSFISRFPIGGGRQFLSASDTEGR